MPKYRNLWQVRIRHGRWHRAVHSEALGAIEPLSSSGRYIRQWLGSVDGYLEREERNDFKILISTGYLAQYCSTLVNKKDDECYH